jgi:hypothetical protein
MELAFANELLLPRMQPFVAFAVVLTRECFAAYSANEGSLVRVRT